MKKLKISVVYKCQLKVGKLFTHYELEIVIMINMIQQFQFVITVGGS